MSVTISAPTGFFQGNAGYPVFATDLQSALTSVDAAVDAALTAAAAATAAAVTAIGGALPLTGGTLSGPLVGGTANFNSGTYSGTMSVAGVSSLSAVTATTLAATGTLTVGPGGSGSQNIVAAGTGNFGFTLGGSSSLYNFKDSGGVSRMQISASNGVSAPVMAPTTLNVAGNITITGGTRTWTGASPSNAALLASNRWIGSGISAGTFVTPYLIQINEGIDVGANGEVDALIVHAIADTAGFKGQRHAATITQDVTAASAVTGNSPTYSTLNTKLNLMVNDGGTSLTPAGARADTFSFNNSTHLGPGVTFVHAVIGQEIDVWTETGSSYMDRVGLLVCDVNNPADAGQGGARDDVSISIQSTGRATNVDWGWEYGLEFGRHNAINPMRQHGTMIMTTLTGIAAGTNTCDTGCNFLPMAFNKWAFASRGFSVDGAGVTQIGTGVLSPASTGLKVDAVGAVGTGNAAPVAGGVLYVANDLFQDPYGGIHKAATVNGSTGAVLTLTTLVQPFFPTASTPANPVPLTLWRIGATTAPYVTDDYGSGLTANLTWDTSRTRLDLNPSGGLVTLGGLLGTKTFTVATLPAASAANKGCVAYVTDATAPTYRGALTGGGAVVALVFSNGVSWTSGG